MNRQWVHQDADALKLSDTQVQALAWGTTIGGWCPQITLPPGIKTLTRPSVPPQLSYNLMSLNMKKKAISGRNEIKHLAELTKTHRVLLSHDKRIQVYMVAVKFVRHVSTLGRDEGHESAFLYLYKLRRLQCDICYCIKKGCIIHFHTTVKAWLWCGRETKSIELSISSLSKKLWELCAPSTSMFFIYNCPKNKWI